MEERYKRFSYLISASYKYIQKIEGEQMEKYGLNGSYAQYLSVINRFPQGVTASQLCEICGKDKAAVSRTVAKLEEKGLIIKCIEGNNNYRAKLVLTDEGKSVSEYVSGQASKAVLLAGKGLSVEQITAFYEVLDIITDNLKDISDNGLDRIKE